MQADRTQSLEHALRPGGPTIALRQRLCELAAERRRFGYRRLGWLLVREGRVLNRKKLYRLYREEKLMLRRRRGRKRALGTRAPVTYRRLTSGGHLISWPSTERRRRFRSYAWSTTSAANVWPRWWIPHWAGYAWCANLTA